MSEPFCDYVGVTVPSEHWAGLRADLEAELDAIGMGLESDQERVVLWRSPGAGSTGTVRAERRGMVWAIGTSGVVCAGLRLAGRFNSYLANIGTRPHRVTRLDAAVDVQEDAAPIVERLAAAGRRGELSLTRKGIPAKHVETHIGTRVDGVETGTVYLGSKQADARMVVYDKRHERICRKLPDVGNLTRYELRLRGGTGITLRDVAAPAGVFWHHAAPDFLSRPDPLGATLEWSPGGTGFELTRLEPLPAAKRLQSRIRGSVEVVSLLKLAAAVGPFGFDLLVSELQRLADRPQLGVQGLAPAETACSVH